MFTECSVGGGGGLSVHCQWEEWGRGAECSLSVGGGGLSVHCQSGGRRGAECSLSVGGGGLRGVFTVSGGRRGAECSLSVGGGGGLSVHCQWEEGG